MVYTICYKMKKRVHELRKKKSKKGTEGRTIG